MKMHQCRLLIDGVLFLILVGSAILLILSARADVRLVVGAVHLDISSLFICAAAILVYGLTHILRTIRLYLIIGESRLTITTLLGFHMFVSLTTLVAPFKIGDIVRALEAYRLLGDSGRGIVAVWIDRLFDVVVIIVLFLIMMAVEERTEGILPILSALSLFLALSMGVIVILPRAIESLARALTISASRRTFVVLKACRRIADALARIPSFDKSMLSLLGVLTFSIWILECCTISLVLILAPGYSETIVTNAIHILSEALRGVGDGDLVHVALYRLIALFSLALLCIGTLYFYIQVRLPFFSYLRNRAKRYKLIPLFQVSQVNFSERT